MRRLTNLFLPNPDNNHKALLLQNYFLGLLLCLVIGLQVGLYTNANHINWRSVLGTATELSEEQIILQTNQARAKHKLSKLQPNDKLNAAVQAKLDHMFANQYWDHYSPTNVAPWDFILSADYAYQNAGENLGRDFNSTDALVNAWLESPSHRENLLNPAYKDIGVAIGHGTINGQETTLIVQLLGRQFPADTPENAIINNQDSVMAAGIVVQQQQNSIWQNLGRNNYLSTKTIALTTISLLVLILSLDALYLTKYKKNPRLSAKYWAHILLLITVGTTMYLS